MQILSWFDRKTAPPVSSKPHFVKDSHTEGGKGSDPQLPLLRQVSADRPETGHPWKISESLFVEGKALLYSEKDFKCGWRHINGGIHILVKS